MIHRLDDKNIYVGNQAIDRVYLGDKVLKSNEPLIYMATDEDFKIQNGNHIYIGSALQVDITDYISSSGISSSSYMFSSELFSATPVTKVVFREGSFMGNNTFSHIKTDQLDLTEMDFSKMTGVPRMFAGSSTDIGYIDMRGADLSHFDGPSTQRMFESSAKVGLLDLRGAKFPRSANMFQSSDRNLQEVYISSQEDLDIINSWYYGPHRDTTFTIKN